MQKHSALCVGVAVALTAFSASSSGQVCQALDPIFLDGLETTCLGCREWAVATDGDDTNAGTRIAPLATIQAAIEASSPGDRVSVLPGTYEGVRLDEDHSGTASNPIVLRAEGDVVIDRGLGGFRDNIEINGADYIHVLGFRVRDAERAGIAVLESRGAVIAHNDAGPNGRWGVFTGFATDLRVMFNRTHDSGVEHGIYISNSRAIDDNVWVLGNESFDNGRSGIQFNGDCFTSCSPSDSCAAGEGLIGNSLIGHNRVYGNATKGLSIISVDRMTIFNNRIYDNLGGAASVHLTDEPGCGRPTRDTIVVNNTLVEPLIAPVRITDAAFDNVIFNNIAVREGRTDAIVDEVGVNNIDNNSNVVQTDTSGLFVNDASKDFLLAPGSAAVSAGVATFAGVAAPDCDVQYRSRPAGPAIDAGALETN